MERERRGEEKRCSPSAEAHWGRPATFEPEGNRTDQTAGRRFVSPFLLASRRPSYRFVQIRAASFNGSDPVAILSSEIINLVKLWLTFSWLRRGGDGMEGSDGLLTWTWSGGSFLPLPLSFSLSENCNI